MKIFNVHFKNEQHIIVLFLIGLQLVISLPFINSFAIGLDEPFTIFHSQRELDGLLTELNKGNNAPLHFILLHFWIKLFGISAFAVRSLSLVFGILSTVMMFKISRLILPKQIALTLSLFFIFSTFNHYYNLEARNYSLLVALCLLIVYDQLNIIKGLGNNLSFVRIGMWNILLLYTHYLGVFILAIEAFMFLIFIKQLNRRTIFYLFISLLVTIILYLPSLIVFFRRANEFSSDGTWVLMPHWTELYGNILRFMNGTLSFFIMMGLAFIIFLNNRLNFVSRLNKLFKNHDFIYFIIFFLLAYTGMFVFSFVVQPIFIDRYLIYTSPLLFICLGFLIFFVLGNKNYNLAFLFVIPMMLTCAYRPYSDRDADNLVEWVKLQEDNSSEILISPPFYDLTFLYYYDPVKFKSVEQKDSYFKDENISPIYNSEEIAINEDISKVIFIDAKSKKLYPENNILANLNMKYNFKLSKSFKGDFNVYVFNVK